MSPIEVSQSIDLGESSEKTNRQSEGNKQTLGEKKPTILIPKDRLIGPKKLTWDVGGAAVNSFSLPLAHFRR